jgi:HD-GYP domain-containing protein (c-di-GMP phosphodiesterase class II)
VLALTALAAATALVLVALGYTFGNGWVLIALSMAAAIAERASVRLSDTTELSISPVLTLFAAVLFGPLAGGVVGAASEVGDAELFRSSGHGRSIHLKWLTYTSSRFMAGATMGLMAQMVQSRVDGTAGLFVSTLAASVVGEALEILFATLTSRVRGNRTAIARIVGPVMVTAVCVYAPVVGALVFTYENISPWTSFLFLAPALAAQQLFSLYQEKARLYEEQLSLYADLQAANTSLRDANLSFATALVQTLEESDRYTAGHSRAVATYSRDIASKMGLSADEQERTYLSGLVHDIGKIGLPGTLLNKEGRLTLDELREMERHSEIGERILSKVEAYSDVALIVRHHHERMDGEGYPDKIRGDEIPLISRIIAVADAYNAMTSDRPYRAAMEYIQARDRLLQAMGSQFFVDAVVAFLSILAEADNDYRRARGVGFGPVLTQDSFASTVAVGAA